MTINPLARVGLYVLLIVAWTAAAFGYGRHVESLACTHSTDQKTIQEQNTAIKVTGKVIEEEHADDKQTKEVDHEVQAKLDAAHAESVRLTGVVIGLRQQLATTRADALSKTEDRTSLAAQVASLSDSLGECSSRYTAVAGQFDACAAALKGWQNLYPEEP